jgi:hypothetical protein
MTDNVIHKDNGNIVHVNFTKARPMTPLEAFWAECQWGLCMDDYAELVDSVVDPTVYAQADDDIRELAEVFFELDAMVVQS